MKDTRSHDPWDVIETQVGQDTTTSEDPLCPSTGTRGSYTSTTLTARSRPTSGYYRHESVTVGRHRRIQRHNPTHWIVFKGRPRPGNALQV